MEKTIANEQRASIPKWLHIYTILLGVFGIGMGLWSVVAPSGMLDVANLTLEGTGESLIIGLFAARNAAFGFLFLLAAFVFRTRDVLLTVFVSRFLLDLMDTIVIVASGNFDFLRAIEQLVGFIIPVAVGIFVLLKMQRSSNNVLIGAPSDY